MDPDLALCLDRSLVGTLFSQFFKAENAIVKFDQRVSEAFCVSLRARAHTRAHKDVRVNRPNWSRSGIAFLC